MILKLGHKNLDVYKVSKSFAIECYKITKQFPTEEKYGLVSQIRRAAVSVILNIAEGASRMSIDDRKRFYEISRSSLVEIDAAFEVSFELKYLEGIDLTSLGSGMTRTFQMLTKLLDSD